MISFRKFLTVINEDDVSLGAPPAGGDAGGADAGAAPGGDAGAGAPPADMGGGAPPPDMGGGGAPPGGDMGGAPPAAGGASDIKIKLEEQPRDVFEFLKELDKKGFFNMPRK